MTKIKPLPPLELLEKHFHYDPDTGDLTNINSGNVAQRLDSRGKYIQVDFQNQTWQAHRFCYLLGTSKDPGLLQIDHIDRNYSNNRLNNLRLLDNGRQQLNTKVRSNNKSGTPGVFFDKKAGKYRACIGKKKKKFLGTFASKEEAVEARLKAQSTLYPEME